MNHTMIEYALPEWSFHGDRRVEIVAYTAHRKQRYTWMVPTNDINGYNTLLYGQWPALCERLQIPAQQKPARAIRRWYRFIPEQQWLPLWWVVSAVLGANTTTARPIVSIEVVAGTHAPDGAPVALASNIWNPLQLDILWIGDQRISHRSLITLHLLDLFHRYLQKQAIPPTGALMPGLSQEQASMWFAGMYPSLPHNLTSVYWSEWRYGGDEVSVDSLRSRLLSDLPMIQQRSLVQVVDAGSSPPTHQAAPSVVDESRHEYPHRDGG